jgi:hypothetical protein
MTHGPPLRACYKAFTTIANLTDYVMTTCTERHLWGSTLKALHDVPLKV